MAITQTQLINRRIYQRSGTTADITVTGTTDILTGIEFRIVEHGTNTPIAGFDWTYLTDGDGANFTGVINNAPEGGWYNVDVREQLTPANTSDGTNRWGIGIVLGTIGQSNMARWFSEGSDVTPNDVIAKYGNSIWGIMSGNGATQFANRLNDYYGVPVALLNSGLGGSALTLAASTGQYWLDQSPASVYDDFKTAANNVGGALEGVIWAQGERDASSQLVSQQDYAEAEEDFFTNQVRADIVNGSSLSNLPIIIKPLGRNSAGGASDFYYQSIRSAQPQGIAGLADTVVGPTTIDLPLEPDNIHYTDAANITDANRLVGAYQAVFGDVTEYLGPQATGFDNTSPTKTTINLAQRAGSDFAPSSGITGFEVSDDNFSTIASISSAVRTDASSIQLTHDDIGTSKRYVRYLYGANPVVSAPVYDNSTYSLPMEWNSDIGESGVAIIGTQWIAETNAFTLNLGLGNLRSTQGVPAANGQDGVNCTVNLVEDLTESYCTSIFIAAELTVGDGGDTADVDFWLIPASLAAGGGIRYEPIDTLTNEGIGPFTREFSVSEGFDIYEIPVNAEVGLLPSGQVWSLVVGTDVAKGSAILQVRDTTTLSTTPTARSYLTTGGGVGWSSWNSHTLSLWAELTPPPSGGSPTLTTPYSDINGYFVASSTVSWDLTTPWANASAYEVFGLPSWATDTNGVISGTVPASAEDLGRYELFVMATDSSGFLREYGRVFLNTFIVGP